MFFQLNYRNYFIVIIFFFVLVAYGCEQNNSTNPEKKEIPSSVPNTAIWVGGADGGVYISLSKQPEEEQHVYYGEIYYENGVPWYKGNFFLTPKTSPLLDYKNSNIYSAWDGDILYLNDGRLLETSQTNQK